MDDREMERANWIYNDPYIPDLNLLDRIHAAEKALGFKLFYWQKTYIHCGHYRCMGSTTAEALRDLLCSIDAEPLDFTKPAKTNQESVYRADLMWIRARLLEHDVPMRKVKTSGKLNQVWVKLFKEQVKSMAKVARTEGVSTDELLSIFEEAIGDAAED